MGIGLDAQRRKQVYIQPTMPGSESFGCRSYGEHTNIKGELSYGSGALLEMTTPKLEPDTQIDLTFELPQRWVDEGQVYRAVHFHGTIKDGTAAGVIRDGAEVFPVKLEKNSIASVYRQVQSHLPFNG